MSGAGGRPYASIRAAATQLSTNLDLSGGQPVHKRRPQLPCIFAKGVTRGAIDDHVAGLWLESFGDQPVPFGDLRLSFKRFHCGTVNPMGGECPFVPQDCARAFLGAVKEVCIQNDITPIRNPRGYFVRVAKSTGAMRADLAVGRRAQAAMMRRTSVPPTTSDHAAPTDPASSATRPDLELRRLADPPQARDGARSRGGEALDGEGGVRPAEAGLGHASLPRRSDGAVSVGELLGDVVARSRQRRGDDREEGPR